MTDRPIVRKARLPRVGFAVGWLTFWFAWPVWYLVLSGTRRVRVLVLCGDYVLLERSYIGAGGWGLPGGGLHARELPLTAARRELHEETGLVVPVRAMRLMDDAMVMDGGIRYHAYYVVVEVADSAMQTAAARAEVNEICWAPIQQLSTLRVMPSVEAALQLWERR